MRSEQFYHNSNNEVVSVDAAIRDAAFAFNNSHTPETRKFIAEVDVDRDGNISVKEAKLAYSKRLVQRGIVVLSFVMLVAMTLFIFLIADNEKIEALDSAMDVFVYMFGAIVLGFFGLDYLSEKAKR